MTEEWRPIVGVRGDYSVSDQGRVRNNRSGTIRRPAIQRQGYLKHTFVVDGRKVTRYVHRLVAEAFLPASDDPFVRHLDDDKANNTPGNLAWGQPHENTADGIRNGVIHTAFSGGVCRRAGHPQEGNDLTGTRSGYRCAECRREWERSYRKSRRESK